ncbi:OPT oligopeptide transporter protein-domain-containing protein [Mycena latifolia]|nr:OPT oligopeptide transporter protein-domain-containing protein [Mycena latifolia]
MRSITFSDYKIVFKEIAKTDLVVGKLYTNCYPLRPRAWKWWDRVKTLPTLKFPPAPQEHPVYQLQTCIKVPKGKCPVPTEEVEVRAWVERERHLAEEGKRVQSVEELAVELEAIHSNFSPDTTAYVRFDSSILKGATLSIQGVAPEEDIDQDVLLLLTDMRYVLGKTLDALPDLINAALGDGLIEKDSRSEGFKGEGIHLEPAYNRYTENGTGAPLDEAHPHYIRREDQEHANLGQHIPWVSKEIVKDPAAYFALVAALQGVCEYLAERTFQHRPNLSKKLEAYINILPHNAACPWAPYGGIVVNINACSEGHRDALDLEKSTQRAACSGGGPPAFFSRVPSHLCAAGVLPASLLLLAAAPVSFPDIVAVQRVYYDQTYNFGYQWMVVMSTQLMGFSMRVVTCALFNTLHTQQYAGVGSRGGFSREKFFYVVFAGSALWYLVPGYLFTGLSFFWAPPRTRSHSRLASLRSACAVCWIKLDNLVVNQRFGVNYGLAVGIITFDWAQITYIGSWWAKVDIAVGFVFFFWILMPVLYFSSTFYSKYMPISSGSSFDNTGHSYNVSRILTVDKVFDLEKYKAYSPIFLSTTFSISYSLLFASMHAFLFFHKQIWMQSRHTMHEQPDIHAHLMAVYPQVPEWRYAIILRVQCVFGVVAIEVWDTKFPVQCTFPFPLLALVIAFFYVIPIGMIQAITNQQVGLNTWGYITMAQALTFTSVYKLGHYMKIPLRIMFTPQVIATVVAGTVQLGMQAWMFTNIEGMCDRSQKDGFWRSTGVFGTASIIWGVIGPARQFSHGQMYDYALTFFLIGFLCPLIAWLCMLKWPISWLCFSGMGLIPPANSNNYVPWAIVGFIFHGTK